MRFGRVMTSMSEALKLPTPGRCDASDIVRWVQYTTSRERAALFYPMSSPHLQEKLHLALSLRSQ